MVESQSIDALSGMSHNGRPSLLGAEELVRMQIGLLEGRAAHGFGTPLWALKRVQLFIECQFGVRHSDAHVWLLLGKMGFSSQKPEWPALERDEAAIEAWEERTWPALKKSRREGRLIFFVDESGISRRLTRVCTWVPKGNNPVVQLHFN